MLIACFFLLSQVISVLGQYLKVDYPASNIDGELKIAVTYTLWIPEGVKTIRGIIVHQHGAGREAATEGATAAYDLHWQALAKKWDCALMGPSYHVLNDAIDLTPGGAELWFDPRLGSAKTFLKSIDEFAAKSGHAELKVVPWVLWGHSGGGIWSDVLATLYPKRIVAMWLRSGTAVMFRTKTEFPQPQIPREMYNIPIFTNPGTKERRRRPGVGCMATFQEYRSWGAPVGYAEDPLSGHETADSRYLAIPFLDACLAMRLPGKESTTQDLKPVDWSKSWLAGFDSSNAVPASAFKGNPNEAIWLPNEAVAKAWTEYVKTGSTVDITPPPSPFNIKINKSGIGTEITWNAEADFESGIRSFIIIRDGKELARVPENPIGKFGRPLFQSMTYHDTPTQPMPEMKYVDNTPDGAKHAYTVLTENSVGLRSTPK